MQKRISLRFFMRGTRRSRQARQLSEGRRQKAVLRETLRFNQTKIIALAGVAQEHLRAPWHGN